jgi:hypothetical protein
MSSRMGFGVGIWDLVIWTLLFIDYNIRYEIILYFYYNKTKSSIKEDCSYINSG